MSSTTPRRRWRRALSAITALAVAGLGLAGTAAPAQAADTPTITVTDAPLAGGKVTVTGSGFTAASPGVYLGYGPATASGFYSGGSEGTVWIAPGNADGESAQGKTAPMTAEGSFSVQVTVPAQADAAIAFFTSKAHGGGFTDKSQNTTAVVTYKDPTPVASSEHSIQVDAATGLTVTVKGSNYDTVKYSAGVHVAVIDRNLSYDPIPAQTSYLGTGSATSVATDFTASTKAIAATELDKDKDYDVIVWPRRTNPSDANVAYRANLNFTAAQKEALFPTPAPEATTTHAVKTATATDGLTITVTGANYAAQANGVYVAAIERTKTGDTITAADALGATWVRALTENGFTADTKAIAATSLDKTKDYDVIVWKGHTNPTTDNVLSRKALELTAAQKEALFPTGTTEPTDPETPEPTKPSYTATVTGAAKDKGMTTSVDIANLPARGLYVAIVERGTATSAITQDSGFLTMSYFVKAAGTLTVPTASLKKDGQYDIVVWTAHTLPASNPDYLERKQLTLTSAQIEALFGTTTEPTEPETPGTDPEAKDRTITVTGTKFTNLPKTSTGKDASGAYVAIVAKGTKPADITESSVLAQDWVMPMRISNGAFTSTLTVPAKNAKDAFEVISWSAHGNATDATVIDRQDLPTSATAVSLTGPGASTEPTDPTDPETPGTDPTDPETPGTDPETGTTKQEISKATLTWGIKESFRQYVIGPIADGSFTATDGAKQVKNNGVFTFSNGTGTLTNAKGTIAFDGTVKVNGHHGEMNLTITNLRVNITSATTAQLIADVTAPESSMTDAINAKNVVLANLAFNKDQLTFSNVAAGGQAAVTAAQMLTLKNAKATLTNAGAPALAGFYEAGTQLDAVSVNADVTTSTGGNNEESEEDDSEETGTESENENEEESNGTSNGTGSKPTATQQCRTVTVPGTAGGVSLSWGVKSSFVSYVKGGIAKGAVTTGGGAAASGSGFSWGAGSGSLSANGTGTVSFPGSVHFTGHDGLMDTTISGLRLQVTGSGSAVLYANVKSQDMEGKDLSASGVAFANVSFSGGSASGFSGASVKLTAAGAKAFAGFYSAGETMDSMTLTVGKASAATTKEVCGDAALASTGVMGTENLVGAAGLLALLGAAAISLAARRQRAKA